MAKLGKQRKVAAPSQLPNHLVKGSFIEGKIRIEGDIRFDGNLNGEMECTGKLVVGDQGLINGNVHGKIVEIIGEVKGDLHISETATLYATAVINGNIYTKSINIEPGAVFNGKCIMNNDAE